MRKALFTLLVIITALASSLPASSKSWAAADGQDVAAGTNIAVNTTTDSLGGGACSLRAAVQAANTDTAVAGCPAGSGADTISLEDGETYLLSIAGGGEDNNQTGDLDIISDLTIQGANTSTIIDADDLDRVIHVVSSNAHVTLLDLTIQNGFTLDNLGGGGILNQGTLTLQDVHLYSNYSYRGGGVRGFIGSLAIRDSEIDQNDVATEGGGVYADGPLTIQTSYVHDNLAGNTGGGIRADGAFSLFVSTLAANTATYGGGLFNDSTAAAVDRVFIYQNHALTPDDGQGGGIYNNNTLVLTNSTLNGNTADFQGGAIYNLNDMTSYNNTIRENTAAVGGGIFNGPDTGMFTFANTIFYLNDLRNCANDTGASLISTGHNIEWGQTSINTCELDGSLGDMLHVNPLLGDLDENGGTSGNFPFMTYKLLNGSPAMDGGSAANCTLTDQRSYTRPVDGDLDGANQCDIGAYEYAPGGAFELDKITQNVVEEAGDTITLTVSCHTTPEQLSLSPLQVNYGPLGGTATNTRDYQVIPGVFTWSACDSTTRQFQFTVVDDGFKENQEIGLIGLSNPTNGATMLSPYDKFTLVIAPSDPLGSEETSGVYLPLIAR